MLILNKIKNELHEGKTFLLFGFLSAFGQGLAMLAPLIVAKFFLPQRFGSYSLARMIIFFFLTIIMWAAQTPFIVFSNRERAETGKINKSFSIQCLFTIIGLCIFMAIAIPARSQLSSFAQIDSTEFIFVCLAFIGYAIESFIAALFMGLGQRIKNSFVELTFGALTVGLVFVFYWVQAINIKNVFLIYIISSIIVVFIFIWFIDFQKLRPFTISRKFLKDMFDFTKWVLLGSTAVYFINWGDSFVLRVLNKPLADIGTYNLGYGVFKGICALIIIIGTYFLPFVSSNINNYLTIHNYLYKKRPRILLTGIIVIGLVYIITPFFFKVVYGQTYQDSIVVLRLLLIGCLLMLYSIFYDPIFHAAKRYKFTQTLNITQAVVNLAVDFLLVPRMGLIGTAIGAVCGYFCRAVIMEIYYNMILKNKLKYDGHLL